MNCLKKTMALADLISSLVSGTRHWGFHHQEPTRLSIAKNSKIPYNRTLL